MERQRDELKVLGSFQIPAGQSNHNSWTVYFTDCQPRLDDVEEKQIYFFTVKGQCQCQVFYYPIPCDINIDSKKHGDVITCLTTKKLSSLSKKDQGIIINFINQNLRLPIELKHLFSEDRGNSFAYTDLVANEKKAIEKAEKSVVLPWREVCIYYKHQLSLSKDQVAHKLWLSIEHAVNSWITPAFLYAQENMNTMQSLTARDKLLTQLISELANLMSVNSYIAELQKDSSGLEKKVKQFARKSVEIFHENSSLLKCLSQNTKVKSLSRSHQEKKHQTSRRRSRRNRGRSLSSSCDLMENPLRQISINKIEILIGELITVSFNNFRDPRNTFDTYNDVYDDQLCPSHISLPHAIFHLLKTWHMLKIKSVEARHVEKLLSELIKNIGYIITNATQLNELNETHTLARNTRNILFAASCLATKDSNHTSVNDLCANIKRFSEHSSDNHHLHIIHYYVLKIAKGLNKGKPLPQYCHDLIQLVKDNPSNNNLRFKCLQILKFNSALSEFPRLSTFYVNKYYTQAIDTNMINPSQPQLNKAANALVNPILIELNDKDILLRINKVLEWRKRIYIKNNNSDIITLIKFVEMAIRCIKASEEVHQCSKSNFLDLEKLLKEQLNKEGASSTTDDTTIPLINQLKNLPPQHYVHHICISDAIFRELLTIREDKKISTITDNFEAIIMKCRTGHEKIMKEAKQQQNSQMVLSITK